MNTVTARFMTGDNIWILGDASNVVSFEYDGNVIDISEDIGGMTWTFDSQSTYVTVKFNLIDNLTNMSGLFGNCPDLSSVTFDCDTSNVTDMSEMFYLCKRLTTIDVSCFDTSNVTTMRGMFFWTAISNIDVSHFNTSNVTDISIMFDNCQYLKSIDLSNFDTSKVTDMGGIFVGCEKLTSLESIYNWDTSNVTDMELMFQLCSNITELDLSSWNMANVQSNSGMFSGCSNLITLRLPDLPHIGSHMFYNCSSLDRLHLSSIVAPVDDPNPTNPTEPFENIKMNGTLYVPNGSTGYDSSPWTTLKNTYGWNFLGATEWTMNSLFWMESTATTPTNQTAILSDRAIYKSSEELGVLEVSFDVDWLTYVGQYWENGIGYVELQASDNRLGSNRRAKMTVYSPKYNETKTVIVVQQGLGVIIEDGYFVGYEGGDVIIKCECDGWIAQDEISIKGKIWGQLIDIPFSVKGGYLTSSPSEVIATIPANDGQETRIIELQLWVVPRNTYYIIEVEQYSNEATPYLYIKEKYIRIPMNGGKAYVTIITNTDWTTKWETQ